MYRYDEFDAAIVADRISEFRDQVNRRLSGELDEEAFRPLRLMNGVYLQLHAYMLRVCIPYGEINATQLRRLGAIAQRYDRGYGHFTTRQNIQFNWVALSDIPAVLEELAEVGMHAIQTSGNCIRNTTTDPLAGVAADEVEDPRPWAELIRQWSTFHPEFTFLPRKFKVAITGASHDRAAIRFHDIGLELAPIGGGEIGFKVFVGGGMGRTPRLGRLLRDDLPKRHLLSYIEAILRVYNRQGQRENKYKARIKILVDSLGVEAFRAEVDAEWEAMGRATIDVPEAEIARIQSYFVPQDSAPEDGGLAASRAITKRRAGDPAFAGWLDANVHAHKVAGHAGVTISLKPAGGIPGDATTAQLETIADLAERYSKGLLRVTHEQNLLLPHVRQEDLPKLWADLVAVGLETANVGLIGDIISCPGLDYCSLATARSIPIAQAISARFADPARLREIGPITLNISGCINACGHHHAGNIGILGLEKTGNEAYQLVLGGAADETAAIARITGQGFSADAIVGAVETVVDTYIGLRHDGETFIETFRRLGVTPFKEALYGSVAA
ncbi:sulfite reductase [Rhodospirillum rubrum]|uniref:nitrite/sulfite reductase n=1 Tax=Rhodospirillum rubrum TaxID=1085 RepID=UPI0019066EC5|nr:nitrite/sulfite reductase [Rhodospirillum rubrum]MBK1665796.1 sulfite reductase [Rhodospirillum rubrum]MBK1677981.1 sulfite reductase [Rhodospirillum rubrum]